MSVIVKKGLTESYSFYGGEVELQFDPEEHIYYLIKGEELLPVDGVTTVVHIIDKSNVLLPWACKMMAEKLITSVHFPITEEELTKLILASKSAHREKLEKAGDIGKIAHRWIEEYIKFHLRSDIDWISDKPEGQAGNCCDAALSWMKIHNVRWRCTERKIYSREWNYAGTLDGIALVDSCDDPRCCPESFRDRLSLIDWKSSNYLYNEFLFQTAAYQRAYEEETGEKIEDRWIVQLGKTDGEFNAWHMTKGIEEDFHAFTYCLHLTRAVKSVTVRMKIRKDELKKLMKDRVKMVKEKLKRGEKCSN